MGRPGVNVDNNWGEVKDYLDWILDAINQYTSQMRKITFIALFLMAVFGVISQSSQSISLQGVNIAKGSVVASFLPAVVACLFLQLVTDTNRAIDLYNIFSENFSKWSKQSGLSVSYPWVMPPLPLVWGASMTGYGDTSNRLFKVHQFLVKNIDKVTPFIGLAFLVAAYIALALSWGKHPSWITIAAFSVSLLVTSICIVFSILAYFQRADYKRQKLPSECQS